MTKIIELLRSYFRRRYTLVIAPECLLTDDELYDLAETCGYGRRKFLHTTASLWRPFVKLDEVDECLEKIVVVPLKGYIISETQSNAIFALKARFPHVSIIYTTMDNDIVVYTDSKYDILSQYRSVAIRDEMIKKAFFNSNVFKS